MGSSSSHVVSSNSSSSRNLSASVGSTFYRPKFKLSSLFCGDFAPKPTFELGDCTESTIHTKTLAPISDDSQNSIVETSSLFSSEVGNISSIDEIVDFSGRNSSNTEEPFVEYGMSMFKQESDRPLICGGNTSTSGHDRSSSLAHQLDDLEYHQDAVVDHNFSDLRSLSIVSDSLPRFDLPGDDHAHATTTYSPGFLVFDNDCGLRNGNLLHLNVLSISSNFLSSGIAEINSPGSRRNSGRLFWDALSRHNFRRHRDSPTIVFATDLADARRDGFLISAGISILMELKEIWVALTREANRLHFLHLDSTLKVHVHANRSSRMKIPVLLKVLDEIHHQSLMVLLSTLLLPAPESVVDAFPLKYHKEIKNVQSDPSDIQQCYICLTDYEKGDQLSVLPCNHEFYVPCIDKWLKEVNRYVQSAETMCVTVLENVPPKTQKHHYYNTLL